MCVKEQHKNRHDNCSGCESQFKDSLVKKVEIFLVLFKEPKHLTHKQGIQHELQLMSKSPLPNVRMYHFSPSFGVISYKDTSEY